MWGCINCGHEFDKPKTEYDELNDEQYDVCPQCGSDDIMEDDEMYQRFLDHEEI